MTNSTNIKYWWKWTLNCGIGELIGIAAAAMIAIAVTQFLGEPETVGDKILGIFIMLFAGLIEGFILGTLQWKVLKIKFPDIPYDKWSNMTILVAMMGWLIGTTAVMVLMEIEQIPDTALIVPTIGQTILYASGLGLVLGAIFGYFQWLVFRKYALHTFKWIWANAIGWAIAMVIIFYFSSLPNAGTPALMVLLYGVTGGVLAGLSVGAITGLFLNRIIKENS